MLTKAWIALIMGLLLGSLFFSSGCGWWNGYSNSPNYGAPCNCGVPHGSVPAAAAGGTPGWHAPTGSGASVGGAVGGSTTTPP
jgi:uncharacterized membrane protein YphA (DoxX/SURF4 family)